VETAIKNVTQKSEVDPSKRIISVWEPITETNLERWSAIMTSGILETDETQPKNANESLVRVRAYELWQARGCPDGSDQEDWFTAEEELSHQTV
jgi:hypothetical protein